MGNMPVSKSTVDTQISGLLGRPQLILTLLWHDPRRAGARAHKNLLYYSKFIIDYTIEMPFFPPFGRLVHTQKYHWQLNLVSSKTFPILCHRWNPVISHFPLVSVQNGCYLSHIGCDLSDVCSSCLLFLWFSGVRLELTFESDRNVVEIQDAFTLSSLV